MQGLQEEKEKAVEKHSEKRAEVDWLKEELTREFNEFQDMLKSAARPRGEAEGAECVQRLRRDLKNSKENPKAITNNLKRITEEQKKEKDNARMTANILGQDAELRKAIVADERQKLGRVLS